MLLVVTLLALSTACNPQPAPPPTDLAGLHQRLDELGGRVDVVSADLRRLEAAAVSLDAAVRAQERLDLSALTGVVVETWPADASVLVEPGECPAGTPSGRAVSTATSGTSYHPLSPGTYCVSTPETDAIQAAGVTLRVPDGVIVSTTLYARQKEATP